MRIVILDGNTLNPGDLSWNAFDNFGEVIVHDRTPPDKIVEYSKGADIILTNKAQISGEHIRQLPDLKYIGVTATGFNIIDAEAAKKQNIVVSNVPGYGTSSVVQMTFALLLELCLHVQDHSNSVKAGQWSRSADFCYWNFPLTELEGKTIGIIGFGTIGERVGDIATAFGMNIIATANTERDMSHRKNFRWVKTNELLSTADVVSIHCPLTPETEGLINAANLKKMKSSAFLINTSRGPIIVEADLAQALNENIIAGAGLDVLSTEPPPFDNPLISAKNCIITPHISWATKEARARLMDQTIKNLEAFIDGKPVNVVNG